MPYQSNAQRKYLHAVHPEIARRWDKENPKNAKAKLPEHKKKKKK